ncbi:hypothetical protein [Azospira restricta]|uniref:CN hydrolase domain-containing protein n=1 Tax=Azospira restricta TaxID=404405 RepID=A0A974SMT4_9RHOO|nr:hypothetical protein [Azospira restricta]QRJ62544.1 hypothetical protein IWH25_12240 [Azospira restricta]
MIRVALVQFNYLPAYFSPESDHLSIEGFTSHLNVDLSRCLNAASLRELRQHSRETSEGFLRQKLEHIVRAAHAARANLVVFPEYSIPISVLPICQSLSKELSCTIVAGSHRVPVEREKEYASLGFAESPVPGTAVAPVFRPNGKPIFFYKKTPSKWEPDLEFVSTNSQPEPFVEGETECVSLLLCIDALHASNLGEEFRGAKKPRLLICPSLSPSTTPFEVAGAFLATNDCLLAYANDSVGGQTSVYASQGIIEKWVQPLFPCRAIPEGDEAILRADLDLTQIVPSRGSVYAIPKSIAPWAIPIVHSEQGAAKLHESLVKLCDRYLGERKLSKVAESINNFLAVHGAGLEQAVYERLRSVRDIAQGAGDLNREKVLDSLRICFVPPDVPSLQQFEADTLASLQRRLRDAILEAGSDATEIGRAISAIKLRCTKLPAAAGCQDQESLEAPSRLDRGVEWSIARFQNRGGDLDRFRQLVLNDEIGIIFIAGPSGIGKTDFVRAALSKLFPGHGELPISVYSGMSASQLLAEVAVSLGRPYDVDALDAMAEDALAIPVKEVAHVFQNRKDQFLVLDDLALVFRKNASRKDAEILKAFLSAFGTRCAKRAAKVIICWSGFLPEFVRSTPYSATINLKVLEDEYVRRIVERQIQLVKDQFHADAELTVDHKVVSLLSGHPLSAVTLVECAREKRDPAFLTSPVKARESIAKGLLPDFASNPEEKRQLAMLSCIRRPISLSVLRDLDAEGERLADFAAAFAERAAVLLPERDGVKLHEAIREEFLVELEKDPTEKRRVHAYLARLYKSMLPNKYVKGRGALIARAEYVHHLVAGGALEKTTQEARRLITQIKRSAREVYAEERNYVVALDALNVAASISTKDEEIQEALGRCNARLQRWDDSDAAFLSAIDIGRAKKKPVAWILKNWGHIRARFSYYDRAEELFAEAEQEAGGDKDASILGARAYMNWKRGELADAEKGFCAALDRDPWHEYSIVYFGKLLRYLGKTQEAADLDRKYQQLKESNMRRPDALRDDFFDNE